MWVTPGFVLSLLFLCMLSYLSPQIHDLSSRISGSNLPPCTGDIEHLHHQDCKPKSPNLTSYLIFYFHLSLGIQKPKTNTRESPCTTPPHPQWPASHSPTASFITQLCPSKPVPQWQHRVSSSWTATTASCWLVRLSPSSRGPTHCPGAVCAWYSHDHSLP